MEFIDFLKVNFQLNILKNPYSVPDLIIYRLLYSFFPLSLDFLELKHNVSEE